MTPFVGVRVLVVEDEGAVALLIEDMLEEFGCEVVASVARLAAARDMAGSVQVDLAILDVNLAGERVFSGGRNPSRSPYSLPVQHRIRRQWTSSRIRRVPGPAQAVFAK